MCLRRADMAFLCGSAGRWLVGGQNKRAAPARWFLVRSCSIFSFVISYLLPLYEDANRRTESYEYAYTYNHQYECLHLFFPPLVRYYMNVIQPLYEYADRCTKSYEYAYTYDHQYECLHLFALLYYNFMLFY